MSGTSTPLVALDIDGVLNPRPLPSAHADHGLRLPGYVQRGVTLVPGKRQLPYLRGHGVEAVEGRVLVNAAHGRWVRTLLDRGVDVGWATTWEHYANEVFGPLLGLPPLPLAIEYRADVQNGHYRPRMDDLSARAWKSNALWSRYRGRPLVWIDDDASVLTYGDSVGRPLDRGAPMLAIRCRSEIGLNTSDMNKVDDWLGGLSAASDQRRSGR